jgi:hypothetical protein
MSNLSVKHNCSFSPAGLCWASRRERPLLAKAVVAGVRTVIKASVRQKLAAMYLAQAKVPLCWIQRSLERPASYGIQNSYIVSGTLNSAAGNLTELKTTQKDALLSEFTRRWELMNA